MVFYSIGCFDYYNCVLFYVFNAQMSIFKFIRGIKIKILIYARVSTSEQNVDQQAAYCKEWAKRQGYEIIWTIKDKESGRLPLTERRQFLKIINNEYNFEYDAILVYHLDRLTRNWDDVTMIEKFFRENWDRVKLLTTTFPVDLSHAQGRWMFRSMMAQFCYMPEDTMEKSRIGIERAKKEGKYTGGKKGRTWTLSKTNSKKTS